MIGKKYNGKMLFSYNKDMKKCNLVHHALSHQYNGTICTCLKESTMEIN
jgi:hypothetical protein